MKGGNGGSLIFPASSVGFYLGTCSSADSLQFGCSSGWICGHH